MILYIMRHGIAWDQAEWAGSDHDRPLTDEGIERTRKVADKLAGDKDIVVDEVWSSPLRRALQTAELAAAALGLKVEIVDPLECGATVASLMRCNKKRAMPGRLLTVGHEPDCGEIVSELIGDHTVSYAFKRAGVAKLEGEFKPEGMRLIWQRAPKDVLGD